MSLVRMLVIGVVAAAVVGCGLEVKDPQVSAAVKKEASQKTEAAASQTPAASPGEGEPPTQGSRFFNLFQFLFVWPSLGAIIVSVVAVILLLLYASWEDYKSEYGGAQYTVNIVAGLLVVCLIVGNARAVLEYLGVMGVKTAAIQVGLVVLVAVGMAVGNMSLRWARKQNLAWNEIFEAERRYIKAHNIRDEQGLLVSEIPESRRDEWEVWAANAKIMLDLPQPRDFKALTVKWAYTGPFGLPALLIADGGRMACELLVDASQGLLLKITQHYERKVPRARRPVRKEAAADPQQPGTHGL